MFRCTSAKALLLASFPDRGGIVVRMTTLPLLRHFSMTARVRFSYSLGSIWFKSLVPNIMSTVSGLSFFNQLSTFSSAHFVVLPPSQPYSGPRQLDQQSLTMYFLTIVRLLVMDSGRSFGAYERGVQNAFVTEMESPINMSVPGL